MSDNEDLLGDDLGDHSLADYNLGNDEEEQLLADDYEGNSHNVPSGVTYREQTNVVPTDYNEGNVEPVPYIAPETECVVPNLTVEIPNTRPEHCTYAPYEPEHAVPPAIPAAPIESPQIVPSEMPPTPTDMDRNRERFISERPAGAQRMPQVRVIPDSLDNVCVPRGSFPRGRSSWRAPHYRHNHPYRRNNMHFRGNFNPRPSFPPPQRASPPQNRPDIPEHRPDMLQRSPEQSIIPEPRELFQNFQRFPFRPNLDERPSFIPNQPFERPMFRPFGHREVIPHNNVPQVTIHQPPPVLPVAKGLEPEVRMLPVLPPNLPGGLTGKKVLINPHFKGNFQPPVEGPIKDIDDAAERFIAEQRSALARAASRNIARRSPQRFIENTTIEIENEFARSRRSDDELLRKQEEFIHANRAGLRRRMRTPSPPRRSRSPTPPPRDARDLRDNRDPRDIRDRDRRDERRPRPPPDDEEMEYRRKVREQETMRERVLRAKEVRRRKNAVALQKQLQERERDKPKEEMKVDIKEKPTSTREEEIKPDTTKTSPEREEEMVREEPERDSKKEDASPLRDEVEVNSTCEALTPPRETQPTTLTPERSDTPPLPPRNESDDDLDLILGDIDGILSDEDDSGRFKDKEKTVKVESSKPSVDLRSKLPPKTIDKKPPNTATTRQKITFSATENKKKEKSPIRRTIVTSSTKPVESVERKPEKIKPQTDSSPVKSRQRIIFDSKKAEKTEEDTSQRFISRRVILQRKVAEKEKSVFSRMEATDPTKPNPGIFNRAFKTAIGSEMESKRSKDIREVPRKIVKCDDGSRKIVKNDDEPQIEYESGSEDENVSREVGLMADVSNLPHGMTDTRLKTLAGNLVQSLILDKEARTAKITFKTTIAAESFKKKFNNKMVAASRLTVTLQ
ncbi:unnamed protein product [Leptosia nina]|uniref:Uncharacterized protein n=1 Tax=Leptosia nina TaxID=320188 RepID=A0AAV1JF50_9NEOP